MNSIKSARTKRKEHGSDVDLDALARDLVPRTFPLLLAELAKLAAKAMAPSTYSSRRGGGPAGIAEKRWKKIAKEIGRRPAGSRWFVVTRDAYEAWERGQATPANDGAPEPWTPQRALALAGLRGQR